MNVIITSHQKDVYGAGFSKVGVTYDSMKGEDYLYDIVFHIIQKGKERIAETIKERAIPGKQKFPEQFVWSYENFLKFYGADIIQKEATPVDLATNEQVSRVLMLVEALKIDQATIDKWMAKCDCESFDEMSQKQITGCIEHCEKKLSDLTPTQTKPEPTKVENKKEKK